MARRPMPIFSHPVNNKALNRNTVPHYFMPGLNTYTMSNVRKSDEAVQFYSAPDRFNLPVPFIALSDSVLNGNAVLDLVYSKINWKYENKKLLKKCKIKLSSSSLNDLKNKIQSDVGSHLPTLKTMPGVLVSYTTNLMKNPDTYFDSMYNWYFKNTIEKFQIDGKWCLACARGENLDFLDIVIFSDDNLEQIQNRVHKLFKGPIFDIKFSSSNELMMRQKTKLFLFGDNSSIDTFLNNNSIYDNCDVPFADADISSNNFCTADVKHVIKLWKDRKCVQNKYFEIIKDQTDSFIHLSYLPNQTNVISIIDRHKLYLIDTRTDLSKPCSTYEPNAILDKCEELTALKSSHLNTHSIYVASNHSVLTLDNRMGFTYKSYHMLSNPPTLINSHCYENSFEPNEMLFLGNQISESIINLSYTSFQDDFLLCNNMASSVPKPLDSLQKVRLQGHCLNPVLLDRFSRCLVGSTAFGDSIENLKLFSVNSVGDLFVQKLNDDTAINVTEFEKLTTIKPKTVSKLYCTSIIDMSKLWEKEQPKDFKEKVKEKNFLNISKQKMLSYVDHLAPIILSPWDMDDLSEWENEDENVEMIDDLDCNYDSKVRNWFEKNDLLLGSAKPMESIHYPPNNSSTLNTNIKVLSSKTCPTSENDEDSSSGFTISLKSDDG